jgi:hypothetical protein
MRKSQVAPVCIVLLILASGCLRICFAVDLNEAAEEINRAEISLNSAFVAVVEAYGAGAEVEGLVKHLEVSGGFLSEANLAFRSGDYEAAILFAAECRNAVSGLVAEAEELEAVAERTKSDTVFLTMFLSGVGFVLLLVLGFVGWLVLKERYFESVLEMRPEVEEAL